MSLPRVLVNALSLTQGGGRTYVRNILRELGEDTRGFEIQVLAAAGQLEAHESYGFEVLEVELPRARSALRTGSRVLYEQSLLPWRGRRHDLIYCVADLSPLWSPTPTVVAMRNLNIYDRRFYDGPRTRALFRMARLGLRRAAGVVCPSRSAAATIAAAVGIPVRAIDVIHHGVAADLGHVEPIHGPRPYLFLPAHLERHKNFEVLFEALRRLEDSELELWIAGGDDLDPAWAAHLRTLVKASGLEARVRFLGAVPYGEILSYHRGAKAMVFPSLLESFGHPLLEAMAVGTPVLASDIPASREIAEGVASFFDPSDPAALAGAIEALDADPAGSAARVERGLARVRDFSWSRAVDRLCSVFGAALRRATGAGSRSVRVA